MREDRWRDMGATEYEVRAIRFGILDLPSITFTSGVALTAIPKPKRTFCLEEKTFARVVSRESTTILVWIRDERRKEWGGWCRRRFGLEGGRSGGEKPVRDKILSAEPALAEKIGEDGKSARLFFEPDKERPTDELGCEVVVQALLPAPKDARLLPISL
jgi:hypothetical protein